MEVRSYSKEVKIANILFMNIFNDIKIYRYNKKGEIQRNKEILVPVLYGNTSSIIKEFKNSNHNLTLPIISVLRGDTIRDIDRVCDTNNIASMLFSPDITSNNYDPRYLRPNPVNIEYELNIWARTEEDLNQIESNFIGWFKPSVFISWLHPFDRTKVLRSLIVWSGTISHELSTELDGSELESYKASTNFTFKTYAFIGDSDLTPLDWNSNQIEKIFIGDEDILDETSADTGLWINKDGNIVDNDGNILFDSEGKPNASGDVITDSYDNIIAEKQEDGSWTTPDGNIIVNPDGTFDPSSTIFSKIIRDGFYCVEVNETTNEVWKQILAAKTHKDLRYHEDLYIPVNEEDAEPKD